MTGITEEMALLVAIGAVLLAAGIGFFVGRRSGNTRERVLELESEVSRQSEEIASYKQAVDGHFDKTASLFVSMAGSYKELFEHLSSGYDELSTGSTRELFRERVAALLPGAPSEAVVAAEEAVQDPATAEVAAGAEDAGAAGDVPPAEPKSEDGAGGEVPAQAPDVADEAAAETQAADGGREASEGASADAGGDAAPDTAEAKSAAGDATEESPKEAPRETERTS